MIGRRIIERVIVGVAVAIIMSGVFWAKKAFAYPATSGTMYRHTALTGCPSQGPASGYVYATAVEACQAAVTAYGRIAAYKSNGGSCTGGGDGLYGGYTATFDSLSGSSCLTDYFNGSGAPLSQNVSMVAAESQSVYTCPNGGTLSGSTCTCGAGYTDSGTACVPNPVDCDWPKYDSGGTCVCSGVNTGFGGAGGVDTLADSTFGPGSYINISFTGETPPASKCVGGCTMNLTYPGVQAFENNNGTLTGTVDLVNMRHTGTSCTGGDAAPTPNTDAPIPCPQGTVHGTVNGIERCLPGNSTAIGTTGTTTNTLLPDGTTVAETVTEDRVTNCSGPGSCSTTITTTTTTTVPGTPPTVSTVTTTGTSTRPGDGSELGAFCDQNPNSPICKQSAFSGTCAAVACEGDAIQCAIAREQHKRNCEMLDPRTGGATPADAGAFYDANSKGEGIAKSLIHTDGTLPTMDQTTRGISGAALADVTYSVGSIGNITIPYSNLNNILGVIGNIVLALALIIGARIFYNGAIG